MNATQPNSEQEGAKREEPVLITYTATIYEDKSLTICAGLAAVMEAHKDADAQAQLAALRWFQSRYITDRKY